MTVSGGTITSPIVLCAGLCGLCALWVLAVLCAGDCSRGATGVVDGMNFRRCWLEPGYSSRKVYGSPSVRYQDSWCEDNADPSCLTDEAIRLAGRCALWVRARFAFDNGPFRMTISGGTTTSPGLYGLCAGLCGLGAGLCGLGAGLRGLCEGLCGLCAGLRGLCAGLCGLCAGLCGLCGLWVCDLCGGLGGLCGLWGHDDCGRDAMNGMVGGKKHI